MKTKKAKTQTSSTDRISNLPDNIKHHILSSLPQNQSIATSVLSKAWRDVWLGAPSLDLGYNFYHQCIKTKLFKNYNSNKRKCRSKTKRNESFHGFIDKTIYRIHKNNQYYVPENLNLYIPKSELDLELNNTYQMLSYRINCWIDHAIRYFNLKELKLKYKNDYKFYKLPDYAFVAAGSLKRLSLDGVNVSQKLMNCLATNCPLIESISFFRCPRSNSIKVTRFPRLLEFVLFDKKYSEKLKWIKYASILSDNECVINGATCKSLKYLSIYSPSFPFDIDHQDHPRIGLFSYLKHLELDFMDKIQIFDICSSYLESLCLVNCPSTFFLKIDAPNLKDFTYKGWIRDEFQLNCVSLMNASVHLVYNMDATHLINFIAKLSPSNCLELNFPALEVHKLHDLAVKSFPIYHGKHLKLEYCHSVQMLNESYVKFLLRLAHHPETISINIINSRNFEKFKVLKFKYKEEIKGVKKCGRCKYVPNPCWKHDLQEVTIENYKLQYYYRKSKITRAINHNDKMVKDLFQEVELEDFEIKIAYL